MVKQKYKFPMVASDVLIFTIKNERLHLLLIKMKKKPFENCWAIPGGLVNGDETLGDAARRHLKDKTGVQKVYLEQLYTFSDVDRDPFGRVISAAYYALIPEDKHVIQTTEEYDGIDWFDIDDLPKLAYDNDKMVKMALGRIRGKLTYTNIVYALLPKKFTLSHLQHVYEVILKKELDKRNFRKKILSLGLIKETGEKTKGQANRPAKLYTFVNKKLKEIEIM